MGRGGLECDCSSDGVFIIQKLKWKQGEDRGEEAVWMFNRGEGRRDGLSRVEVRLYCLTTTIFSIL